MRILVAALCLSVLATAGQAQSVITLKPTEVTEWKAVYGLIETRDRIAARARIGGTLTELTVTEGNTVKAGQKIATVVDDKIAYQLGAVEAKLKALQAQLANAKTELGRGQALLSRGVSTNQQLDTLQTRVDVLNNQIAATQADRKVVQERAAEGAVLAPIAGKVLQVPVTKGAVIMPGEVVAQIGGGGFFLRLSVPERFADSMHQGDPILISTSTGTKTGRLAKIYPLIQKGRVTADVEVKGLPENFVDARVPVRLPVGRRKALMVPASALITRAGVDFVRVMQDGRAELRTVVPGTPRNVDGHEMIEILTGLSAGDKVVADNG